MSDVMAAAKRLIKCPPPDAVHEGIYATLDEMAADAVPVAIAYLMEHTPDPAAWNYEPQAGDWVWLNHYKFPAPLLHRVYDYEGELHVSDARGPLRLLRECGYRFAKAYVSNPPPTT
jgi:hypothetical protein